MRWHLEAPEFLPLQKVDEKASFFLIGSCFSSSMATQLKNNGIDAFNNPRGTVYNPFSIANTLNDLLEDKKPDLNKIFSHQNLWHHWDFHSSFSSDTRQRLIENLETRMAAAAQALHTSEVLILTLGSAWMYEFIEGGFHVSNCHKVPSNAFSKSICNIHEMVDRLSNLLNQWIGTGSRQVLLTLSPVRYIRDGLINDRRSKARLLEAIHLLCETNDRIQYVPVYEWATDVLRDYRFAASDLVHPSDEAIQWIWEQWRECMFTESAKKHMQEAYSFYQFAMHKPMSENMDLYKKQKEVMYDRWIEWRKIHDVGYWNEMHLFWEKIGS